MKVTSGMAWLSPRSASPTSPTSRPAAPASSRRRCLGDVRRMHASLKSILLVELRTTSKAANPRRSSKPFFAPDHLLQMPIQGGKILLSQTLLHRPLQDLGRQRAVGAGLSRLPRQVNGHLEVLGEVGRA